MWCPAWHCRTDFAALLTRRREVDVRFWSCMHDDDDDDCGDDDDDGDNFDDDEDDEF